MGGPISSSSSSMYARHDASCENDATRNSPLPRNVIASATPEMQSPACACAVYKRISAGGPW